MEGLGGGAPLALRVHRPRSGSRRRRGRTGGARRPVGAVCMRVGVCARPGTGKGHVCLGCVRRGEPGLRLYVCSLKWVERWPVPGMFHDVVQPQEWG